MVRKLNDAEENETSSYDSKKTDAIAMPLININGMTLQSQQIEDFNLTFINFTPELTIKVNDGNRKIQYVGGAGLANNVNVILTCPVDGMYKKISLPFYIKTQKNITSNIIEYVCGYKHNGLNKISCEQIGDGPLTTYEFCEKISKLLQLGFAATEKCKDISDSRYRQIYSQRIGDFIEEQIDIGGLDEDSIFDAWIDIFGYLVLVNFSWVMHQNIKPENISMTVVRGARITESDDHEQKPFVMKRFLTNNENIPISTCRINSTYNHLNTETSQKIGTFKDCWILTNAGDTNTLERKQIQMIEESMEGIANVSQYEFVQSKFLGVEMSEDTPYIFQKELRDSYLRKFRSRQLIVALEEANYGLERGTLVYLMMTESDPDKIKSIMAYGDNSIVPNLLDKSEVTPDKDFVSNANKTSTSEITEEGNTVGNPALSGFYYITGIEYIYMKGEAKIKQNLYLIKQGAQTTLLNNLSTPKLFEQEYKSPANKS